MKKRIFSLILSVCLLATMFVFATSAADIVEVEQSLPTIVKFCPGTVIGPDTEKVLPTPVTYGSVYSKGWEIQLEGTDDWVPYNGEALDASYDGAKIRYFAVPYSNNQADYKYSNECELIVKHNPQGAYMSSGTEHWRLCADCGQKDGSDMHTFFDQFDMENEANDTICKVCGAKRTSQWTGLFGFFQWLLKTVMGLFL